MPPVFSTQGLNSTGFLSQRPFPNTQPTHTHRLKLSETGVDFLLVPLLEFMLTTALFWDPVTNFAQACGRSYLCIT
jgi:hypothetical protein